MTAGDITALVVALAGLVTAVGTVMAQISHMNWHAQVRKQPSPPVPPVPPVPPQS